MKKIAYYTVLVILLGVFAFSAYKIGGYYLEKYKSDKVTQEAAQYVHIEPKESEDPNIIDVDFKSLQEVSDDIVGWLYCPDTQINYPVAQGSDNAYYLTHLLDGSYNVNGTIFMDFRGAEDFSDFNNVLYGHHMKSGAMFAILVKYWEQEFYDAHPCMYLLTPKQNYRLDLFAGLVVPSDDEVYSSNVSMDHLQYLADNSTFTSSVDISTVNSIVTLSTCSYEFEGARYVVMAKMVPMTES